jgi:hypothetical protein
MPGFNASRPCRRVLPMYANTHTTTSVCGLQSTCFRQEARQVIAQACNARVGYTDKHADVVAGPHSLLIYTQSTFQLNLA